MSEPFVHPTAEIGVRVAIGQDTKVWMNAQIREDAQIGRQCIIGRNVYIETGVRVGDRCKIQNNALIFASATLEEGVFIGPGAILTNDKVPRAVNVNGTLKGADDWHAGHIQVGRGASVGAGAIVLTDLTIGPWAMVAAGAVVSKDVPAHTLVVGVPARWVGFVCKCGTRLYERGENGDRVWICPKDGLHYHKTEDGGLTEAPMGHNE